MKIVSTMRIAGMPIGNFTFADDVIVEPQGEKIPIMTCHDYGRTSSVNGPIGHATFVMTPNGYMNVEVFTTYPVISLELSFSGQILQMTDDVIKKFRVISFSYEPKRRQDENSI